MSDHQHPFSVIIPAAGNSNRMGSSKLFLHLANGQTFAESLLSGYYGYGATPVILVINESVDPEKINAGSAICIINEHTEYGRSYSIKLGIQHIPAGHACFIQNVDNPFAGPELLDQLLLNLKDDSYVIPVHGNKGGHPVLLGTNIVSELAGIDSLFDFREVLKNFARIEVPWNDPAVLLNINTREDYLKFLGRK